MSDEQLPTESEQAFHDPTGQIHPIQMIPVGPFSDVPVPFVRITTCGNFKLEVLQEVLPGSPLQGRYQAFRFEAVPEGVEPLSRS